MHDHRSWPPALQPADLIEAVARRYGLDPAVLLGHGGSPAAVVWARHELAWLLRQHTHLTFAAIGEIMDGRDATTVRHSVERVAAKAAASQPYRDGLADYTNAPVRRATAATSGSVREAAAREEEAQDLVAAFEGQLGILLAVLVVVVLVIAAVGLGG